MAIHAISLVKNEADIIEHNLGAAICWCDHIYVFDNGSTDGTWEKVQAMATTFAAVVPWKQDPKPFRDALRSEVFDHFRGEARTGDWWCILDADEFYIDDPAEFLARVPDSYSSVWPQLYTYLFTEKDAEEYARDPENFEKVRAPERMRYYVLGNYSEPRFVRHTRWLTTHPFGHRHPIYPRRIKMRHYGYRSPNQITRRLETRLEPMLRGEFIHEKRSNWQPNGFASQGPATPADLPGRWTERIVSSEECYLDTGPESLLPPHQWEWDLLMWTPTAPSSLAGRLKRLSRALMLDRMAS